MITIIHGEDIVSSRSAFLENKSQNKDAISLSGETVSFTELVQILEGGGLFQEEKHLFIEDLLSKRKKSEELKDMFTLFEKYQKNADITLWESKSLTKTFLSQFPKSKIEHFPLPQSLFQFLDALLPGNGKTAISIFHKTLATTDVNIILFMLVRQIRLLLAFKQFTESPIDEVKRMSPWQKGKLLKQAKAFTTEKLILLHKSLFELDLAQKTGKSALTLTQAIDFFLLQL